MSSATPMSNISVSLDLHTCDNASKLANLQTMLEHNTASSMDYSSG